MPWKFLLVCAVLGTIGLLFVPPAKADQWLTYQNDRYGTTIDYPDQFKAEPPPGADDGRTFTRADGAKFSVYASYNAENFNLAAFQDFTLKNLDPGQAVTYKASGKNWFVISDHRQADLRSDRRAHGEVAPARQGISIAVNSARESHAVADQPRQ